MSTALLQRASNAAVAGRFDEARKLLEKHITDNVDTTLESLMSTPAVDPFLFSFIVVNERPDGGAYITLRNPTS